MPAPRDPDRTPYNTPIEVEPYGIVRPPGASGAGGTPPVPPGPPPMFVGGAASAPLPNSGQAIASLVLGIVSCVLFCLCYGVISIVCGILALVFAKQAETEIAAGRANPAGRALAKAGLICGIVGICIAVLYLIAMIVVVAFAISSGGANPAGTP